MNFLRARFSININSLKYILIEDLSNKYGTMSITNDVENVLVYLNCNGILAGYPTLYYIDTEGSVDIIMYDNNYKFIGFKTGFTNKEEFYKSIMMKKDSTNSENVTNYINKFNNIISGFLDNRNADLIEDVVNLLYKTDGRIFIIGNGGSAANASHFAQDLAKGTMPIEHSLRDYDNSTLHTISLCDNIPFITAIANDDGYENIFIEQLRVQLVMPDDVLIAISGSGNSPNILKAVSHCNACQMKIISFTGFNGGKLKNQTQYNIHFPFNDMCMTEAFHSLVMHYIVEKLKFIRTQEKNK